jgi:predicted DNA-binding transcriptional regulator AlpA
MAKRTHPNSASPEKDPHDSNQEYIGKAEVARLLGISVRSVERGVVRDELPRPIHIGRLLRWRRKSILDYLKRLEDQAQR